ncbi:3-oxoacyl-[acyl-carrier protein] reductase [Fontimonas thermophila]|uniref:3-oxoacyl-[acyl-carrier protein] reductase n=1 Tax=Fontimonas thermophila TaxID=1076937 RepID=A0A1I2HVQ0_9GAMM|nr:3-oxoacyl-ACP reductase [Fontimonas thermophila]SFF32807.1 3-oxoacyl-[acyl-carrier protein] reductase [Fontimonas thermophila]
MSDRYLEFTQSGFGKTFASLLGLPTPPRLRRADAPWAERPLEGVPVLIGGDSRATLAEPLLAALSGMGAVLRIAPEHAGLAPIKSAAAKRGLTLIGNPSEASGEPRSQALIFDASGLSSPAQMREVFDFFQPLVRGLPANGRILVVSRAADVCEDVASKTMSAALRGFVRALGKEIGKNGSTCNLIEVGKGGEAWLDAPLRFFLTPHSAYVSGQVLPVTGGSGKPVALPGSLGGKVALVTGAARGIGAAIAEVLTREGARIVGMDHPSQEGPLGETMARIGGHGLALDVTAPDAASRIANEVGARFGGLDIVVHNAGVTRDKMLRNMSAQHWDMVLSINLAAILNINEGLLQKGLNDGARVVCISSIGGIAGNAGQTNYASTKAGVIGYTEAMASLMASRGGAINAVAPGFIETQMTAQMPLAPREVGRRINSLSQGGLPQDIAEAVAFLASPASGGINGRTLRVCGQNWFGA